MRAETSTQATARLPAKFQRTSLVQTPYLKS
jgi:hypothetical protein